MPNMKHETDITPLTRILAIEAKRRRECEEASRRAEENAIEHCRQVAVSWGEARKTLLAEISAANMLLELHRFPEVYRISDHVIRNADNIAQLDLAVGRAIVNVKVCAFTGDIEMEHTIEGMATFLCKRFRLNCTTISRADMQEVLAVMFKSTLRQLEDDL